MMCPDTGKLLAYLEEELYPEESLAIKAHLKSCSKCSRHLQEIAKDFHFSRSLLHDSLLNSMHTQVVGQNDVWENIAPLVSRKKGVKKMKWRKIAVAACMVLTLGMVVSIPSVQVAAENFLQIFRVQKVDTISFSSNDINQISAILKEKNGDTSINLENFGEMKAIGTKETISLQKSDLQDLGFKIKLPEIEDKNVAFELEQYPVIEIKPDVTRLNEFIKSLGSQYTFPSEMDGEKCVIKMGDTVSAYYSNFKLVQGLVPQVEVPTGIDVNDVARAFVSLPIWPEDVRRQMEAINDWEHTLLIPNAEDNAQKVTINGADGVLLKNSHYHNLLWLEGNKLYVLEDHTGGNTDLLEIAKNLREI